MTTSDAVLWGKAKTLVGQCGRCEDWDKMGLSSTCPSCDAETIAIYERLKRERDNDQVNVQHQAGESH